MSRGIYGVTVLRRTTKYSVVFQASPRKGTLFLLGARNVPLTKKGRKILREMKKGYGAKKGKSVFYASQNKGTIKGTHRKQKK